MKYLEPLFEQVAELTAQVGAAELVRPCLQEWRLEQEAKKKEKSKGLEACKAQLQQWEAAVVKRVRETVLWLLGKVVRASS